MTQPDKNDCECLYTAAAAVCVVVGVWLITAGAWWGWIFAPIGALGLLVAIVTG